jgi:hypothetical protein
MAVGNRSVPMEANMRGGMSFFRYGIWATLSLLLVLAFSAVALADEATPEIVRVSGAISQNTLWTPDHLYVVESDLTINLGITLTIQGGTVVKFAPEADLIVRGALQVNDAIGRHQSLLPLVIGGGGGATQSAAALPQAELATVVFTSLADDSVGGDTNGDGSATAPQKGDWGGIVFEDSSNDALSWMQGFSIRYSGAPGRGNQVGAILLKNASPTLRDGDFSDNYLNGIEIQRNTSWLDDAWDARGIVYHVTGDVTVPRGNTLRLAPGTIVKFGEYKRLIVQGALQAVGTPSMPIQLTSIKDDTAGGDTNGDGSATQPAVRDWGGIAFEQSSATQASVLAHVHMRYTGRGLMTNIAALQLDNCSPTLQTLTLSHNYMNGAQLSASRGELGTLTLASVHVPYILLEDLTVPRGKTLTLQPGVALKLTRNVSLKVEGVFRALGTSAQPISFTSLRDDTILGDTNNDGPLTVPAKGDWGCVYFAPGSDDDACEMHWVRLRYGGSDGLEFSSRAGAIRLNNASPRLTNIAFQNNWANAVEIPAGDWLTDTWDNTDVVYLITGHLRVPTGQALTISPGVIVTVLNLVAPTNQPLITIEGGLRVGDPTGPQVVFTSGRDDAVGPASATNWDSNGDGTETAPAINNWVGIVFKSGADGANSYVRKALFKYAGMRKGTFQEPHGALRFQGVGAQVQGCVFWGNYRGVEALDGGLPTISQCAFIENEAYAVVNEAPASGTVQATNNWWGDATGPRSDGQACNTAIGYGDVVSCGVAFSPWLSARP